MSKNTMLMNDDDYLEFVQENRVDSFEESMHYGKDCNGGYCGNCDFFKSCQKYDVKFRWLE